MRSKILELLTKVTKSTDPYVLAILLKIPGLVETV